MSQFIRMRHVTTRKAHTCFGCLNTIPVGETAVTNTCADSGEIYTLHMCRACYAFTLAYPDALDGWDDDYPEGFVRDAQEQNYPDLRWDGQEWVEAAEPCAE